MKISEEVKIAMINAARDITVAKIKAKGSKFDNYIKPMNWFEESLSEVKEGFNEIMEGEK